MKGAPNTTKASVSEAWFPYHMEELRDCHRELLTVVSQATREELARLIGFLTFRSGLSLEQVTSDMRSVQWNRLSRLEETAHNAWTAHIDATHKGVTQLRCGECTRLWRGAERATKKAGRAWTELERAWARRDAVAP